MGLYERRFRIAEGLVMQSARPHDARDTKQRGCYACFY